MLSFRQLEVFRAVILTGSISQAANQLGIAQPTVTNIIRRLEDVLGVTLFDRSGARIRPTQTAQRIMEVIAPSMVSLEQLSETVVEVVNGQHSNFRMGVSPSVSQALGPRALAIFRKRNPSTTLRMDTLSMKQNRDYLWLAEGNCTVTIFPIDDLGVTSYHISSIKMVCVVPVAHRLASQNDVSITDLMDEPLIFFHPNTPHGILVRKIFDEAGIVPKISIETRFAETAPQLMHEGFGIALQDELTSLGLRDPELKVLPIREAPRQPVLFHCRADNANDPQIELALSCVVEAVQEIGLPDEYHAHREGISSLS